MLVEQSAVNEGKRSYIVNIAVKKLFHDMIITSQINVFIKTCL